MDAKRFSVIETRHLEGATITRQESCFDIKHNAVGRAERLSKQHPEKIFRVYDNLACSYL